MAKVQTRFWFSMYCLTTANGEPPTVLDEIAVRPERREAAPEPGELLPQEPGRSALGQLDQLVDAELRIDLDEQVDVVGHHLEFDHLGFGLGDDFADDRP